MRNHGLVAAVGGLVPLLLSACAVEPPRPQEQPVVDASFAVAPVASWARAAIALAAAAVLAWRARAGSRAAGRRLRDGLLLALGLLGLAGGFGFGSGLHAGFVNTADFYVYFVGSKYFRELGYTHLYHCTAIAEAQQGLEQEYQVSRRRMRDLRTNQLTRGHVALREYRECQERFGPERWQEFRRDVLWFRERTPDRRWRLAQTDHGYNATPAWALVGGSLARAGPASEGRILALALLDPLLLLASAAGVVWAFGWRAACVAAVYWGACHVTLAGWLSGGLLRFDWLAATLIGICLLRRGRLAGLAGLLIGYGALLRIFPGAAFVGLGLQAALDMARRRSWRPPRTTLHVALGAVAAAAIGIPLSSQVTTSSAWLDFVANSRLHLETPSLNDAGLESVIAFAPGTRARDLVDASLDDPFGPWREARRAAFERRKPLFYGLVAGFVVLLAARVAGREPWVAAVLGLGLVPVATELSSYYWSALLVFAFLWTLRARIGIALCALSALSWPLAWALRYHDEIAVAESALFVGFVVFATLSVPAPGREPAQPSGEA